MYAIRVFGISQQGANAQRPSITFEATRAVPLTSVSSQHDAESPRSGQPAIASRSVEDDDVASMSCRELSDNPRMRLDRCRVGAVVTLVALLAACSSAGQTGSPKASSAATTTTKTSPTNSVTASTTTSTALRTDRSSPGRAPKPVGLVAVQEDKSKNTTMFSNAVFDNTSIAGVALRVEWKDIEPTENQFDWQLLDQVFGQASKSNKFVVLILVPGFGTPTWALQGAATATFARQYGADAGTQADLPLPWDSTYLSRWFVFLQHVADRYGTNDAFQMIAAAGPTSVSAEMSLPNSDSDLAQWMKLGYTPDKYVAAWSRAFDEYARIFPRQFFSLALYPGLRIGDKSTRDGSQDVTTRQRVVDEGLKHSDRFALQTSGLTSGRDANAGFDLVASNSGKIVTGFQLSTSATKRPGDMGDAADPVHALSLTLQRGIEAHVDFLEVYEPDVVNPAMQDVLRSTASQLSH